MKRVGKNKFISRYSWLDIFYSYLAKNSAQGYFISILENSIPIGIYTILSIPFEL